MKLTTWTIYKGRNLKNISGKVVMEDEFPCVLLRPDLNRANEFLVLALPDRFVASSLIDLLNRNLDSQQIAAIFQDKMGLVHLQDLNEYFLQTDNLSQKPILAANIEKMIESYSILVPKKPITFDSKIVDTDEKAKKSQALFLDLNFQNMSTKQLLNAINTGMADFYTRLNELKLPNVTDAQRKEMTWKMSGLQTNLILIFEETLKRMDALINHQTEIIVDLQKQLAATKSKIPIK